MVVSAVLTIVIFKEILKLELEYNIIYMENCILFSIHFFYLIHYLKESEEITWKKIKLSTNDS